MSDKEIISQDEIDDLLRATGGDEEEEEGTLELTDEEKDVIGEVGNMAMGSAATALYSLLGLKVEITTPVVEVKNFIEVAKDYERPCVMVEVEYISGLEGYNHLIIKETDAAVIADLMMGGDGTDPPKELEDLQVSAVGEAMNQMMGSTATSMSEVFDMRIDISPPRSVLVALTEDVVKDPPFPIDEPLVTVSFRLKIGDLVDSTIVQLISPDFTQHIVRQLLPGEEEEAAAEEVWDDDPVEEEPVQEQVFAPPPSKPSSQRQEEKRRQQEKKREREVKAKRVQFTSFEEEDVASEMGNIAIIHDIPVEVIVQLGKTRMLVKDILELGKGSVIELDRLAGEPVDLVANGRLIARGEVVVIDENFGLRITEIINGVKVGNAGS